MNIKPRSTKLAACISIASLASGCSTLVAYSPRPGEPPQTLRYAQGVGTLSQKDEAQEIFMYPKFRTQATTMPTFTIGFANGGTAPVNFTTNNVKAYFRGAPVPIYTYTERIAEIDSEKRGKQIALAIVGGLAAGAAAYGASHRTYQSNSYGYVNHSRGLTSFSTTSTTRVYDPASGILAGAAVGGATVVGISQIEYNAQNLELAAQTILQENTVDPMRMVTGDLILKGCCDPYPQENDVVRFEVSTNGKTSMFEFVRVKIAK